MTKEYHIGIDLHKRFSQVAVIDGKGEVIENKRIENNAFELSEFFSSLPKETPISFESTIGYEWLADTLTENGFTNLHMAHPYKVRLIAEATIKTDKVDAATLAHLERTNFLPLSYLPPGSIRETRELLRHRLKLVTIRAQLKNRIHAVLAKRGIFSYPVTDLFGKAGRQFLSELTLPSIYKKEIDNYLSLLDQIGKIILKLEKDIKKQVREDYPQAALLLTIPGISYFSALLLMAEIGDIKRFPNPKKLASHAGLVPATRETADKLHQGHIKKDSNKYIRWILMEAVDILIRKDPGLGFIYRKLVHRKGKNRARVAIAHKTLVSIFYMLKKNENYKLHILKKNTISGKPVYVTGPYMRPSK
jgi:transposase